MKVTNNSLDGRDEEENKLEAKITKNANLGAHQVWEMPSIHSSGREVIECTRRSQETMRAQ